VIVKIVVCVKAAAALSSYVEFTADGSAVDPAYVTHELNEPDAYATEQALRLRDAAGGGEVVVVAAGGEEASEAARQCIRMGADRGVRVWSEQLALHDPVSVGRALAAAVTDECPDLVLCGVQSTDSAQQSTGPALAKALGLPCITVAIGITHDADGGQTEVRRELEGGVTELVEVDGPAVITVQTGLNEPRLGTFREMMRAKKAQIPVVDPGDLDEARSTIRRVFVPVTSQERTFELIPGDAAAVAQRIVELVEESR
jgi:electron transfer flavoprotein beta subunit